MFIVLFWILFVKTSAVNGTIGVPPLLITETKQQQHTTFIVILSMFYVEAVIQFGSVMDRYWRFVSCFRRYNALPLSRLFKPI